MLPVIPQSQVTTWAPSGSLRRLAAWDPIVLGAAVVCSDVRGLDGEPFDLRAGADFVCLDVEAIVELAWQEHPAVRVREFLGHLDGADEPALIG